ncbi:MAG: electron transfer flavoprotein subunit beta/FixA family protein [Deltaproteobacteria bacterium]|nr:electron transfer flavoprotein subunit beta/FixA family protein [Deltaproteobacteria bacterium]
MKILVCIKQVGDDGQMNRFDAHALEEAMLIKERLVTRLSESAAVTVVTAGPEAAAKVIRRAFGLGADKGYHIITKEAEYTSSLVTASRLAAVARQVQYDLILTGIMSADMMAAQTGPMLARIMGMPCATGVVKTNLNLENRTIEVERELENGFRDLLEIDLPALLTIQAGINTLRYPRLSNMLAASQKEIITINEDELVPIPGREVYLGLENPEKTRSGRILSGSLDDQAQQLFTLFKEKDLL